MIIRISQLIVFGTIPTIMIYKIQGSEMLIDKIEHGLIGILLMLYIIVIKLVMIEKE